MDDQNEQIQAIFQKYLDKDEAEGWLVGLKALISRGHQCKWITESSSDGVSSDAISPRTYTRRSSSLSFSFGSVNSLHRDGGDSVRGHSPYESLLRMFWTKPSLICCWWVVHSILSGSSDSMNGHMKGYGCFKNGKHAALATKQGEIFSWGEEAGDWLGHGVDCDVSHPKLIDALANKNVLGTVRVACGVWHAAAVVEVMVCTPSSSNCSSGKLFTWGDGERRRLWHGDKEPKLVPSCVAVLAEPNFCRVASGHSLTVALTTSGHVYTMGSAVYVLTSITEVYTWGKGANACLHVARQIK
ncbi:hypothetical protein H6P81_004143 [Aristolochia fimbriata]|uniref:Uncharacterized protein n=1 Tax=Aristolochia fimbriata TaxID=158543 RepID=A0AAV7FEK6_ARIFI|nr:hypothetical protein H6P81_004143 [Aristolochia fimbriata]